MGVCNQCHFLPGSETAIWLSEYLLKFNNIFLVRQHNILWCHWSLLIITKGGGWGVVVRKSLFQGSRQFLLTQLALLFFLPAHDQFFRSWMSQDALCRKRTWRFSRARWMQRWRHIRVTGQRKADFLISKVSMFSCFHFKMKTPFKNPYFLKLKVKPRENL